MKIGVKQEERGKGEMEGGWEQSVIGLTVKLNLTRVGKFHRSVFCIVHEKLNMHYLYH